MAMLRATQLKTEIDGLEDNLDLDGPSREKMRVLHSQMQQYINSAEKHRRGEVALALLTRYRDHLVGEQRRQGAVLLVLFSNAG
jgi:hypothetical protein